MDRHIYTSAVVKWLETGHFYYELKANQFDDNDYRPMALEFEEAAKFLREDPLNEEFISEAANLLLIFRTVLRRDGYFFSARSIKQLCSRRAQLLAQDGFVFNTENMAMRILHREQG